MSRKINLLIAFSAAVTLLLAAINIYLVSTAYSYKVQEFRNEVKDIISTITANNSGLDSAFFRKKDILYRELAEDYLANRHIRHKIKDKVLNNPYQSELANKLQRNLEHEFPELRMEFAVVIDKFVVYNGEKKADTIYSHSKTSLNNRIIGNMTSLEDAFAVRNYVGTTSGLAGKGNFSLLTEDTLYLTIYDWKQVIFKRMLLILCLSILSIGTVVILFVLALKALIRQKKVSDVKSDFINNITHEFKTPLTTLSVSTKILEDPTIKGNEHAYQNVLQTINRQNTRLQALIDAVMANALGFDDSDLTKESTNLHLLLQSIISDFSLANPAVQLQYAPQNRQVSLGVDKFHITTAIINVLDNAVKYGSSNILINTGTCKSGFSISIRDDGIGIAKNRQPLLFNKFYRVDTGNIHNVKGLGLGLYYVGQIVKAHKGTISVVSDPGKGSSFNIVLPAAA